MNSFYTENELKQIGFKRIGENVLISRKASIYQPELIEIGNNVRIDDFCILSGNIFWNVLIKLLVSSLPESIITISNPIFKFFWFRRHNKVG